MTRTTLYLIACALLAALPAFAVESLAPLEGTVEATSQIPDPALSPYQDAVFVLSVQRHGAEEETPVLLALPAFLNRTLTPFSEFQPGQRIRAEARPFMEMPLDFRETQMLDDFQDVTLELYGATEAQEIEQFSSGPTIAAPAKETNEAHHFAPASLTPQDTRARARRIREDLARIESLLAPHGDWATWYASLAPLREELQAHLDATEADFLRKGDLVLEMPSFSLGFTLPDDDPRYRSVLESFERMAYEFALAGTTLIVVPIPFRDHVVGDRFATNPPADGIVAPYWLKFQHDLLQRDIEIIDLLPRYRAALDDSPELFHFHTRDGHPGTDGALLAAEAIGERLRQFSFDTPRREYQVVTRSFVNRDVGLYFGDYLRHRALTVMEADGSTLQIFDPDSEVFLFGDSMLTAPPGSINGDISAHVVRELGFPVQFLKQAGSASLMPAQLARLPATSFFSQRRVAVFIFAFSFISYEGSWWRPVSFLSSRPELSTNMAPPAFHAATGRLGGYSSDLLFSVAQQVPPDTVRVTPHKVIFESQPHEVTIALPAALSSLPEGSWLSLHLLSTASSTFLFDSPGSAAQPLELRPGMNHFFLPLPEIPEDQPHILRLPADAPEFSLLQIEARWPE